MKITTLTITVFVLCFSCSTPQKEEKTENFQSVKEEVFDIHDRAMEKMGDLRKTRRDLLMLLDSIETDSLTFAAIQEASNNLEAANEGMMSWMRAFEPEVEGSDQEKLQYFLSQRKQMMDVANEMDSALIAGETFLK